MLEINREFHCTRPAMESGSQAEWKGDILDWASVTDQEMDGTLNITIKDWKRSRCGVIKPGEQEIAHPRCRCSKTIAEGKTSLAKLREKERRNVRLTVPLTRGKDKEPGGQISFEVFLQRVVDVSFLGRGERHG